MGFIERLEKKLQKQTEAQRQQGSQQRRERQPVRNLESVSSQEEKSKRYYKESRCSLLVSKLSEMIGGDIDEYKAEWWGNHTKTDKIIEKFKFNLLRNDRERFQMFTDRVFGYIKYKENGLGSFVVFLSWDSDRRRNGDRTQNCMAIEACPSGEIYFHGGLFGSSVIIKDQWQKDKDRVENALEKAYNRPKQIQKIYRPPPPETRGWNS